MNASTQSHSFDLATAKVRDLNAALHALKEGSNASLWRVSNPRGLHALAAGLDAPVTVEIDGPVGYYCAGMNKQATVIVRGNAGVGIGENMMSGRIEVEGDASQAAGATAHGGLLFIRGQAGARCGISMKGVDIVVGGSVGHMSAFMAQAGTLTVLGDAGEALGDSIYEARLYVRGQVKSLGADCVEKEMRDEHKAQLFEKLKAAGLEGQVDPSDFKRYGSARTLYHFHVDNASAY
ncbi:glutamate synthase domain-containing protein 3 [Methylopila capsulata]|uniref:Glutamate synthase domain-containing protein 3 n=1 Tax=Methylopila capsulata TaxID=61654 RepID=A0A9W6MRX7_9HYPH|nr:protein glxC [Methylopila capsulata]MBM7850904.1 glutamate synthase domain-containing protein 3 [Methylopila capsulata]GLK56200.1 protein glxC [Methylopila capsulata]